MQCNLEKKKKSYPINEEANKLCIFSEISLDDKP